MKRRTAYGLTAVLSALLAVCAPLQAADLVWPPHGPTRSGTLPVRPVGLDTFVSDVCAVIDERSAANGVSPHFIARLIAVESRFDPNAVSPAGAQGIAQFMPGTARIRGLVNPFDPASALAASIDYLADLRRRFGNLGLAAIAYNAGEGGAARFLGGGGLPYETEDYVARITGRAAAEWAAITARHPIPPINRDTAFEDACPKFVERPRGLKSFTASAPRQPWGVQISESFWLNQALRVYNHHKARHPAIFGDRAAMIVSSRNRSLGTRRRHAALIGAASRGEAETTCNALRRRSIACLVKKVF